MVEIKSTKKKKSISHSKLNRRSKASEWVNIWKTIRIGNQEGRCQTIEKKWLYFQTAAYPNLFQFYLLRNTAIQLKWTLKIQYICKPNLSPNDHGNTKKKNEMKIKIRQKYTRWILLVKILFLVGWSRNIKLKST